MSLVAAGRFTVRLGWCWRNSGRKTSVFTNRPMAAVANPRLRSSSQARTAGAACGLSLAALSKKSPEERWMATAMDLREWGRLKFFRPRPILVELARLGRSPFIQSLPYELATLRTHQLRPFHERRLGALFFYLMGEQLGVEVKFAHSESKDYDFVAHFQTGDTHHFCPVQMKELPPDFLNATATIQGIIDTAAKTYADAQDLTLAINVNRIGLIVPGELDTTALNMAGVWLFGTSYPDQSRWLLIGDLLATDARAYEFDYPLV